MLRGVTLTLRQRRVLAQAIGTPVDVLELGYPHGVYRSLVIRGLLRRRGASSYEITPAGRETLRLASITGCARTPFPKSPWS